jgi:hypothetical protein
LGWFRRDAGQSLVPLPPDKTTGTMLELLLLTV